MEAIKVQKGQKVVKVQVLYQLQSAVVVVPLHIYKHYSHTSVIPPSACEGNHRWWASPVLISQHHWIGRRDADGLLFVGRFAMYKESEYCN